MPEPGHAGPLLRHGEHLLDRAVMLAMRAALKLQPTPTFVPETRPQSDTLMAGIPAPEGVTYRPAVVGGVQGWWCVPATATSDAAILHLHGGAYVVGSAWAYRHFVGQIAARAGAAAFVPDYPLAPERPFPAAPEAVLAVYRALSDDHAAIAITGDSAGGGLALGLLIETSAAANRSTRPVCGVLMSPWLDLTLSGGSIETQAATDPLLSRKALADAAKLYLGNIDPRDARASPLFGDLTTLPPLLVHVGGDEVLLDDTLRLTEQLIGSGRPIEAHVWDGMLHVFPSGVGKLNAADEAIDGIAAFIENALRNAGT